MKQIISLKNLILFSLLFIGCMTRLLFLDKFPAGMNQDEAMAAYQAISMNQYGIDMFGYHNPVYFIAWGSGMNVLESYLMRITLLMVPNQLIAIRLPQALVACVAVMFFTCL